MNKPKFREVKGVVHGRSGGIKLKTQSCMILEEIICVPFSGTSANSDGFRAQDN